MQLIDIGANLTHDSFDRDRDAVLARAREAGVVQMVITGASREHSPMALELAQQHPGILFATAGVHPHHALEYTDECDAEMRALHAHPEVVAVGECGLDYNRDFSPRPAQRNAFERQLQLASENHKPLFLHQRDAHADFMAMMKNFDGRLGPAWCIALPASARNCSTIWTRTGTSASPAGCATNAVARICASWSNIFRRSG